MYYKLAEYSREEAYAEHNAIEEAAKGGIEGQHMRM